MTDHAAALADAVAIVTDNLAALRRERDMLTHTLVGHNTVVELDGLYVKVEESRLLPNGRTEVTKVRVTTLAHAGRFTPEDAANLCQDGNIRNGNGTTAKPVNLITALDADIATTERVLTSLMSK